MYWNRWVVFVACAFAQGSAGLNYSWAIFAPALKERFNLDELSLSSVATLGFNLGGYFAIFAGAVYDALGRRNHVGPRVVTIIGALLLFTGYFGIYSMATGKIPFNYTLLVSFAFLGGNSGCWFDCTALTTCITNYPDDRGTVVGILKSFLGLTATVYTAIYVAAFKPDSISFILFIALCPSTIALLLAVFINKVPQEYHELCPGMVPSTSLQSSGHAVHHSYISKHKRFAAVYAIVAVIALAGMASAIWSSQHELGSFGRRLVITIMLGLLALLLLVPLSAGPCLHPRRRHRRRMGSFKSSLRRSAAERAAKAVAAESIEAPLLQKTGQEQQPMQLAVGDAGVETGAEGEAGKVMDEDSDDESETLPPRDLTAYQAVQTLAFWLVVYQASIGVGTGLAFLNNIAGHVMALGGSLGGQVVFVSLFSVTNASGRLFFGYLSESYLHSRGTHRTVFLIIISALMTLFAASMCFATLPDLYLMALLGGFAFGGHWAVIPTIISDVFGLKHYASTYTVVQFAPAAGGFLLGSVLVGSIYQAAQTAHGDGEYCIGRDCYGMTWAVLTGFNVLGLLGCWCLKHICREAYEAMHLDQDLSTEEE